MARPVGTRLGEAGTKETFVEAKREGLNGGKREEGTRGEGRGG